MYRGVLRAVSGQTIAPAVTVDEARDHLRVDTFDEDTLILAYIDAAIGKLDGAAGVLSRSLVNTEYTYTIGAYPPRCFDGIELPLCGVSGVSSVQYFDGTGASQTLPTSAYKLVSDDTFTSRLMLKADQSWPDAYRRDDAITITFTSGFGDASTDVPGALRVAILLMVGDMYAFREAKTIGQVNENPTVELLLSNYRKPAIR